MADIRTIDEALGRVARRIRKEQGLTQAELGLRAGVGSRKYAEWESSRTRGNMSQWMEVARALGFPLGALVTMAEAELAAAEAARAARMTG